MKKTATTVELVKIASLILETRDQEPRLLESRWYVLVVSRLRDACDGA